MKKKSVEMRALEMAAKTVAQGDCLNCPLRGNSKSCPEWTGAESCATPVKAHFLSLAKKEMDKEKK